ncbi:MAG: helix-turn-helix domain-containing protein [Planctomycetota bacterium]
MEQKFVSFDEAVEKLGVSSDRLNDLRESGQLRAYRDGKSWKFRRDEIDKLVDEGLPEPPPPSDIGMADLDDLVDAEPLAPIEDDDDELLLAPEGDATGLEDTDPVSAGTELELAAEDADDGPESILLSEEELGESVTGPASTIIGKDTLEEDADLELVTEDEPESGAHQSDVRLESDASNVLSSGIAGSGVLDDLESESASLSAFEDLEELEIDLAAESSRILSPEDTEKAKADLAAQAAKDAEAAAASNEDLALDDDLELEGDNMGSTDVSAIELESAGVAKDEPDAAESEIELATDDDLVLSDGSGSDITLDPSESGISLGSPSDSGLALDDIPLDAGSSAILSSLSLGGDIGSDPELSLIGGDAPSEAGAASGLQGAEDFDLTPMSDTGDDDSSSQVIALDAEVADLGGGEEAGVLEESAFLEEEGDGVVLAEDYGGEDDGMMGDDAFAGAAPAAVAAPPESEFSTASVLALGSVALLLSFCGIMMLDMVRNIWSWGEPYALNSSLIDALLGLFKLG